MRVIDHERLILVVVLKALSIFLILIILVYGSDISLWF